MEEDVEKRERVRWLKKTNHSLIEGGEKMEKNVRG